MNIFFIYLLLSIVNLVDVHFKQGKDYLVGINYFAGWWRPHPNKWYEPWNQTVDWREIYPDRVPLLGDYNDQDTMDKEIEAASQYGVDFFQILYYDPYPKEREPNARFLNRGLKNFINSEKSDLMNFMIVWCNEPHFKILGGLEEFMHMLRYDWLPAFKHPSYLKIDNKLVFKVINAGFLWDNCNASKECVENYLNTLRQVVLDETGLEMSIGGGVEAAKVIPTRTWYGYEYDWIGTYMDGPFDEYEPYKVYDWKLMSQWTVEQRAKHADDKIPYVPYLGVGWDPRPWREPRPSFTVPTTQEWQDDLKTIKTDLDQNENFGIPMKSGEKQKIFNIYAWNEFGEGGYMAPVKGLQYDRLEGVKKVFGR